MAKNNAATANDQSARVKKLLSIKGIFIIYHPKNFVRTFPFVAALLIAIIYAVFTLVYHLDQEKILAYILEKYLNVFPNMLGFSLGGYAIIVGFGNTNFLKRIALSADENEFSMFETLSAIFAFNLISQAVVLLTALFFDFLYFVNRTFNFGIDKGMAEVVNCVAVSTLIFLGTWTLFVIPYLISNIFIFGEAHHITLKHERSKA